MTTTLILLGKKMSVIPYKYVIPKVNYPRYELIGKKMTIALPCYMHRVKSCVYSPKLNFFQKSILLLYRRPGFTQSDIGGFLGLDERLVGFISNELKRRGYLNENGCLTPEGMQACDERSNISLDLGNVKINYLFQDGHGNLIYQFCADSIDIEDNIKTKVDFEFEEEKLDSPKSISSYDAIQQIAKTAEILERESRDSEDVEGSNVIYESEQFAKSINFIPDNKPIPVKLLLSLYLPLIKDGEKEHYATDWVVKDPFEVISESSLLKRYIQSKSDVKFHRSILAKFGDMIVDTDKDYTYAKSQDYRKNDIRAKLQLDFPINIKNIVFYQDIISMIGRLIDNDAASFLGYLQKCYEAVIYDQSRREGEWIKSESSSLSKLPHRQKNDEAERAKQILRSLVPETEEINLFIPHARSLRLLLVTCVLHYQSDVSSKFWKATYPLVYHLFSDLCQKRNDYSHGGSNKRAIITREYIQEEYSIFKDYFNKVYGE